MNFASYGTSSSAPPGPFFREATNAVTAETLVGSLRSYGPTMKPTNGATPHVSSVNSYW